MGLLAMRRCGGGASGTMLDVGCWLLDAAIWSLGDSNVECCRDCGQSSPGCNVQVLVRLPVAAVTFLRTLPVVG